MEKTEKTDRYADKAGGEARGKTLMEPSETADRAGGEARGKTLMEQPEAADRAGGEARGQTLIEQPETADRAGGGARGKTLIEPSETAEAADTAGGEARGMTLMEPSETAETAGEKIPVAVVGLGRIAGLLEDDLLREKPCTHTGAVTANEHCVLAAGSDTDESRRGLFAERWGCPVYADADAMLRDLRPGILIIATHPDSHAAYCALAASRGVPVAVCEKPLADTLKDARRIADIHRRGAVTILTNHERRYAEDYVRAKALLGEERLGRLLRVRAVLSMGAGRRLLDVFWHDATHLADALMFLTDARLKHERIWGASLKAREGTTLLAGRLESPGRTVPFTLELEAGPDHLVFELEFSAEKGRLRIGNGVFEVWESAPSPYAKGFRSLRRTGETFEGPTGYFANMIQDAVLCVRDPAREPRSSALDGLAVIEYLHSVKPWGRFV
ncbi:MAG: Gfo/Idh/MocA family oxidoreductase [Spirochaetaceae bacterium]|jgi:predicted dehydrogenase|nr:Gfo/Idh/MocA family oxidoreductase [Spirochaetaceae bacterium]